LDNKEITSHIEEQNNFDREYGLTDLVSTSALTELCIEIEKIAPVSFIMLLPDGTSYYANRSLSTDEVDISSQYIAPGADRHD